MNFKLIIYEISDFSSIEFSWWFRRNSRRWNVLEMEFRAHVGRNVIKKLIRESQDLFPAFKLVIRFIVSPCQPQYRRLVAPFTQNINRENIGKTSSCTKIIEIFTFFFLYFGFFIFGNKLRTFVSVNVKETILRKCLNFFFRENWEKIMRK